MNFKIESINTLNYIAFHDCEISHAQWQGTTLAIFFDWIDVLKSHPNNETGAAMVAENAVLYFENAKIKKSILYDMSKAYAKGKEAGRKSYNLNEDAEIIDKDVIELCEELTVLSDDVKGKHGWVFSGFNVEIELEFEFVSICWNDFESKAWFEGWGKKENYIKRMIAQDTNKPNDQSQYPLPSFKDILNKIDEMNDIEKAWLNLYRSEEEYPILIINCLEDMYSCTYKDGASVFYLSEEFISDDEIFCSYDEALAENYKLVSIAAIKGAANRFYKYGDIDSCIQWHQSNITFWE